MEGTREECLLTEKEVKDLFETEEVQATNDRSKNKVSTFAHMKAAIGDWDIEKDWTREGSWINGVKIDGKIAGMYFCTSTKKGVRHMTGRHLIVLEKYRDGLLGVTLMNSGNALAYDSGVRRFRFFSNTPITQFHEFMGYRFWSISKTGMPFYYGPIMDTNIRKSNREVNKLDVDFLRMTLAPELEKQIKDHPIHLDYIRVTDKPWWDGRPVKSIDLL